METLQPFPDAWLDVPVVRRAERPLVIEAGQQPPQWLLHMESVLAIARKSMQSAGYGNRFEGIEFRTVGNVRPNAIALRCQEQGLVLIQSGLFDAICAKIERAVRNPAFLPDYLPIAASPGAARFSFADGLPNEAHAEPRARWAFSFLRRTVDFVIHHELAHLTRNHHDLLPNRTTTLAIEEALAASSTGRGTHRRRMMELDADATALDMMLMEINAEHPLADWRPDDIEDEYFNTLLAVIVLCQVFDHDHQPLEPQQKRTHPAPVLRAIRFGEVLHATYEGQSLGDPVRMYGIGDQAWWEASTLAEADGLLRGRWWGDDMADVPQSLVDHYRDAHIRFNDAMERILARA